MGFIMENTSKMNEVSNAFRLWRGVRSQILRAEKRSFKAAVSQTPFGFGGVLDGCAVERRPDGRLERLKRLSALEGF